MILSRVATLGFSQGAAMTQSLDFVGCASKRRMAALLLAMATAFPMGLLGEDAAAQGKERADIRFFAGADTQFGFYPAQVSNDRTTPTFMDAAKMLSRCFDCTRVFVMAGDLSHDGDGLRSYGDGYKNATRLGVKVFDGVGNHDVDRFEQDWTSFVSERGLYQVGELAWGDSRTAPTADERAIFPTISAMSQGWSVYHSASSKIDDGEVGNTVDDRNAMCREGRQRDCKADKDACSSFRMGDAYYCENPAFYYTFALRPPLTLAANPSAYMVQLHNAIYSASAVSYLTAVRDKLKADGEIDAPVILVAHQLRGAKATDFKALVKSMNVAAIIIGHYGCDDRNVKPAQKDHGHCDWKNTIADDLRFTGQGFVNSSGVVPPIINVNAIFHNVFWSVQLSPKRGLVAFRRFNRGAMEDYLRDPPAAKLAEMTQEAFDRNPAALNAPAKPAASYVCDYGKPPSGEEDAACNETAF
jgi:hypothetical protein